MNILVKPAYCTKCLGFGHRICGAKTWAVVARKSALPQGRVNEQILTIAFSVTSPIELADLNSNLKKRLIDNGSYKVQQGKGEKGVTKD